MLTYIRVSGGQGVRPVYDDLAFSSLQNPEFNVLNTTRDQRGRGRASSPCFHGGALTKPTPQRSPLALIHPQNIKLYRIQCLHESAELHVGRPSIPKGPTNMGVLIGG